MKLLLFSSEFPPGPGGIGTHAYQLATQLHRSGCELMVLTPQDYVEASAAESFNRQQPFRIMNYPAVDGWSKTPQRCLTAWQMIAREQPDVILATCDRIIYMMGMLSLGIAQPWLAVEHGHQPQGREVDVKRWALGRANAVVCVSEYTRQRVLALAPSLKAASVILNGADGGHFRILKASAAAARRASLNLGEAKILMTVGNVSPRKGQDIVIRAMPQILAKVPNAHYVAVGLPNKKAEFAALATELGVAGRVHFPGAVSPDELVELLNAADLFVMTSRHASQQFEGFGIAVVEAALCGKPAVVARNSGLVEAIDEGETGLSVREEDPADTATKVVELLLEDDRRLRMGRLAQERASRGRLWSHTAERYLQLLQSLTPQALKGSATSLGRG